MIVNNNELIEIDQWTTGNMFEILDSDLPEHFTVEYEHSNMDCSCLTTERMGKTFGNVSVISVPNLLFTVPGTIIVSFENQSFNVTVVEAEEPETIPCACDVDVHGHMLGFMYNYMTTEFQRILAMIYPVGSIYISVNTTSPATLFGGTWEQIENKFLLAAGSEYYGGITGGSKEVIIPAHKHYSPVATRDGNAYIMVGSKWGSEPNHSLSGSKARVSSSGESTSYNDMTQHYTSESGGATVDTMPPYLTVYVWKRTE